MRAPLASLCVCVFFPTFASASGGTMPSRPPVCQVTDEILANMKSRLFNALARQDLLKSDSYAWRDVNEASSASQLVAIAERYGLGTEDTSVRQERVLVEMRAPTVCTF